MMFVQKDWFLQNNEISIWYRSCRQADSWCAGGHSGLAAPHASVPWPTTGLNTTRKAVCASPNGLRPTWGKQVGRVAYTMCTGR